jgi:hypothetical protein
MDAGEKCREGLPLLSLLREAEVNRLVEATLENIPVHIVGAGRESGVCEALFPTRRLGIDLVKGTVYSKNPSDYCPIGNPSIKICESEFERLVNAYEQFKEAEVEAKNVAEDVLNVKLIE